MKYRLSIGSNIDPEQNIPACIRKLYEAFPGVRCSSVYITDPVGPAGTRQFWNFAAVVETPEPVAGLRDRLRRIETALGRVRDPSNKYAARTIDIDILPQDDDIECAFIIIPLAEIIPDETEEKTGLSFRKLAERFCDEAQTYRQIDIRSLIA